MIVLAKEGEIDYSKNPSAFIRDYSDQAIQCCIKSWNELCPEHQLTNLTEVTHRKKWIFFGHDIAILEECKEEGEISKIVFEINEYLTAKAIRKNPDSPVMVLNCWTWWNCEHHQVHGWMDRITVDVMNGCVTNFPEISPATPHVHFCSPS